MDSLVKTPLQTRSRRLPALSGQTASEPSSPDSFRHGGPGAASPEHRDVARHGGIGLERQPASDRYRRSDQHRSLDFVAARKPPCAHGPGHAHALREQQS